MANILGRGSVEIIGWLAAEFHTCIFNNTCSPEYTYILYYVEFMFQNECKTSVRKEKPSSFKLVFTVYLWFTRFTVVPKRFSNSIRPVRPNTTGTNEPKSHKIVEIMWLETITKRLVVSKTRTDKTYRFFFFTSQRCYSSRWNRVVSMFGTQVYAV